MRKPPHIIIYCDTVLKDWVRVQAAKEGFNSISAYVENLIEREKARLEADPKP